MTNSLTKKQLKLSQSFQDVKNRIDEKNIRELRSLTCFIKDASVFLAILSSFVFILFVVYSFRVKYGVTISKRYVMDIGGVIPFVTKRNIWVGGVKNVHFLVLHKY